MGEAMTLPNVIEPMTPLGRLAAIRELAHFAQVHEAIGEQLLRSEAFPIPEREDRIDQADAHFVTYDKAVGQLIALICDDDAIPAMDLIQAHAPRWRVEGWHRFPRRGPI